VMITMC